MTKILAAMILLFSVGACAEDKIQPLNVKPGLWETTTSMNRAGHMPIPDSTLAKLTPEQRARLEAAMKAQANNRSNTTTHKNCVTKEQIAKAEGMGENRPECTHKVVSSSSRRLEMHMVCSGEGMKGEGTMEIVAVDSENTTGKVHVTVTGDGNSQPMNIDSSFTSKWLGASCGKDQ